MCWLGSHLIAADRAISHCKSTSKVCCHIIRRNDKAVTRTSLTGRIIGYMTTIKGNGRLQRTEIDVRSANEKYGKEGIWWCQSNGRVGSITAKSCPLRMDPGV